MVHVSVAVDAYGCLSELRATGHVGLTGGPRGANVVCAAVTGVIKACAATIAEDRAVTAEGNASTEGTLQLQVMSVIADDREYLRGITAVLVTGIRSLADEFPSEVELNLNENRS